MFCLLGVRRFVVKDDRSGHGLDVEFGSKNAAGSNGEKGIEKGYLVARVGVSSFDSKFQRFVEIVDEIKKLIECLWSMCPNAYDIIYVSHVESRL